MRDRPAIATTKGALVGSALADVAGAAWTQWGASGISGSASAVVRVAGAVIGIGIIIASARLIRSASDTGSVAGARSYQLAVALELVALVGGNVLLGAVGRAQYVAVWVATVVGVHFLAFGRIFWAGFYVIGLALLVAALAGLVVGLTGAAFGRIEATTGLFAAAVLFVAGGSTIVRAQAAAQV